MHTYVWLGIVLLIIWIVLRLGFKLVSGVVHLLVLAAAAFIVWGLVK